MQIMYVYRIKLTLVQRGGGGEDEKRLSVDRFDSIRTPTVAPLHSLMQIVVCMFFGFIGRLLCVYSRSTKEMNIVSVSFPLLPSSPPSFSFGITRGSCRLCCRSGRGRTRRWRTGGAPKRPGTGGRYRRRDAAEDSTATFSSCCYYSCCSRP